MLVVLAPGFGAAEASGAEAEAALIAHWKMDEGSGTTIGDSSGNGYDGTASGGSWSTDVPPAAGAGSYSYQFNGVSSFIDTAVFDINDDFSIAVWVKPADTEAEAILGKHTDAAANQLLFGIYDGDYILNIHDDVQRTYPVRKGAWQHLLLVGRAEGSHTTVTVYRNGISLWTFEHQQVIGDVSGGKAWTIGRDWDPAEANDYFEGLMADLRIYDGALSEAEIAALTDGFAETCTTPSASYPYLHLALMNSGCDIIEVTDGEHEVYEADINDGVIIRGAGREETILKPWTIGPSDRFLTINRNATISDLTFRGSNGFGSQQVSGGALAIAEGVRVTLDNVAFEDNYASFDGGAIANEGELTVLNSRFIDNKGGGFDADNPYRGGAIFNNNFLLVKNTHFEGNFMFANFRGGGRSGGAIGSLGTLRVEDSTFHDNNASFGGAILTSGQTEIVNTTFTANRGQYGTAIDATGRLDLIDSVIENNGGYLVNDAKGAISVAGTIQIIDTRISGNSAESGAALHNLAGAYNPGSTTITRGIITGNTADEAGGAIYNQGNLFVIDSTISGNEAGNYAGAIFNQQTAVMEIDGTTISGNKLTNSVWAYAASAIHNEGALTATNSTISGNYTVASTAEPSAIFQQYDDSSLALIHTTIGANEVQTPGRGFGLHIIGGNVSVLNTLTAGNGRANCLMSAQAPYAGSVNLADDESCDQFVYAADLDLGPLADNGGATETQAIGKDSAARDAGNAAWCEDKDQRGVARSDGQCDVGAFEFMMGDEEGNSVMLPVVIGN